MRIDKKIVDIARRDLLKMAAMTGTAGIISALGETLSPTLAAVANIQRKGKPGPAGGEQKKLDPVSNDLAIVNVAIQLEQKAINTYLGLEKEKLILNKTVIDVARQFADDHKAHRDALIKAAKAFNGEPAGIKGLGTFPIPASIMKKEAEAVRYALAVELIASKIYYDAFKDKLKTDEGRNLVITILPVETQHVGVYRSVLKFIVDKSNKENQLSPYPTLEDQPTLDMPKGFSWDWNG